MSDAIEDLVRAYRGEQDAPAPDASSAATRARLLRSAHRRARRRRWSLGAALVAGILATNSVTWAWTSGRLDAPLAEVSRWLEPAAPRDERGAADTVASLGPPRAAPAVVVSGPERGSELRSGVPPEEDAPETSRAGAARLAGAPGGTDARPSRGSATLGAQRAGSAAPPTTGRSPGGDPDGALTPSPASGAPSIAGRSPGGDLGSQPTPPPSTVASGDEALGRALDALGDLDPPPRPDGAERRAFEAAHERHFAGAWASALARWDDYLRAYPRGRFVPEARFNRAICLLRLGRRDDARAALEAIVRAPERSLHRADAERLIRALDEDRIQR